MSDADPMGPSPWGPLHEEPTSAADAGPTSAVPLGDHAALLAVAQEAAGQVSAWQARLVAATEALMDTPCADPWRPYLAWALGLTRSEASELVELVDRLSELPGCRAVLESGERSMRTVLAIARRATPDDEQVILSSTEAFTGAQLERTLGEWARVVAPADRDLAGDGLDDQDPDPSSASWGWRDGRFVLRADLDAGDGAALAAFLEAERGRVTDIAGSEGGYVDAYKRTCAEALLTLGERAGDRRANDVGFMPESITTNLVIHAHENANGTIGVDRSFIPGVGPVPEWSLGMLAEHGPVVTTVMVNGEPIMASVPDRFATAEQKRALLARDGGCAYPGCGATRRLIAHHIRYFDKGGPTDLRNMVLLCRRHHRIVHRCELRITPDPGSGDNRDRRDDARLTWRFRDSDGTELSAAPNSWALVPEHRRQHRQRRRLDLRPRLTGSGDPLTAYGLDVTIATWLHHAQQQGTGPVAA